ncbi:MAG: ABC transporter substrate-binding protein [Verrucomicrobiota bacterium]
MLKIICMHVLALFTALLFYGCGGEPKTEITAKDGTELIPITVQLDWVAEPEHGGLYQAQALGYFEDQGLKVTLRQGGPNVAVLETVATGQAQIGQSSSTQVIRAASKNIPVTNIAAVFHEIPTALFVHESNPIKDFAGLNDLTVMARPEALWIPFLKKRYNIEFDVIAQQFNIGLFVNDPDFIQAGFFIAEPYYMEKAGAKVRVMPLSEGGWHAYASMFANTDFLKEQPEAARGFLRAYVLGWKDYLEGDPTPAHELIKKERPDGVSDAFLDYSRSMILKYQLVRGKDGEGIGTMSPERIQEEIATLVNLKVLDQNQVTVDDVLELSYFPKGN